MHYSGDEAADDVKNREHEFSETVLDIVAEQPQEPHVADEMKPSAVQEHGGEKRNEWWRKGFNFNPGICHMFTDNRPILKGAVIVCKKPCGDGAVGENCPDKVFESGSVRQDENNNVGDNQDYDPDRR